MAFFPAPIPGDCSEVPCVECEAKGCTCFCHLGGYLSGAG